MSQSTMPGVQRTGLAYHLDKKSNLPPEIEEGNVEYKLKLHSANESRIQHLTSQLQWRLTEHGECYYMVGVDDDGTIIGIYKKDMDESLSVLNKMCATIGAQVCAVDQRRVCRKPELYAAEVCIRLVAGDASASKSQSTDCSQRRLVKVAFLGESDVGKSTLLGVLTSGTLDNGHGSMRVGLLRHRHELLSGRTSSVAVEFLPFDATSKQPIRVLDMDSLEPIPLSKQKQLLGTNRVAQLIDLAGDLRYQKTTYSALTSWSMTDWVGLVLAGNNAEFMQCKTTRDHLSLIIALELPFFVFINKTDLADASCQENLLKAPAEINQLIGSIRKEIFGPAAPPFTVSIMRGSCVSGEGIEVLTQHLFRLHPRRNLRLSNYLLDVLPLVQTIFCIEGVQDLDEVGTVLSGTVFHGTYDLDHKDESVAFLGPLPNGSFAPISLKSMHRMRLSVRSIMAGQMVTMAIEGVPSDSIHRSMMVTIFPKSAMESNGQSAPVFPYAESVVLTDTLEADLVGISVDQATALPADVQGTLYWMGARWNAQLVSLQPLYGETKMKALIRLADAKTWALPGTRVIFAGPNFRLQGLIAPFKKEVVSY